MHRSCSTLGKLGFQGLMVSRTLVSQVTIDLQVVSLLKHKPLAWECACGGKCNECCELSRHSVFWGALTQTGIDAGEESSRVKALGGIMGFVSLETAIPCRQMSQIVGWSPTRSFPSLEAAAPKVRQLSQDVGTQLGPKEEVSFLLSAINVSSPVPMWLEAMLLLSCLHCR